MDGIVAINKSCGVSSSDIVVRCRNAVSKLAGEKIKCGHFGTLDPGACGVLLIGFGKSTRLFDYFLDKKKKYRAQFVFGKQTDTLDSFGVVNDTSKLPLTNDVVACLTSFVGDILQTPPSYCANSVNGVRAYTLARKGIEVELQQKKVKIYDMNIVRIQQQSSFCQSIELDIECGGGTYIRSLCRDIAQSCKSVGYMSYLIRTSCGGFEIEDAVTTQEFIKNPSSHIKDNLSVLREIMPIVEVKSEYQKSLKNGVPVDMNSLIGIPFGLTFDGELYGIARNSSGLTKVITNLWHTEI